MNENIRSQGENVNFYTRYYLWSACCSSRPDIKFFRDENAFTSLRPLFRSNNKNIHRTGSDVFNDSLLPAESNKFQWTESKLKRPRSVTLISLREYQLVLNWVSVAILALKQFNTFQSYAGEEIWTSDKRNGTPRYHRVSSVRTVEFLPKHALAIGSRS